MFSNQKMLLKKVVKYVEGVTQMNSKSPPNLWDPRDGLWEGQSQISSDQKFLLNMIVVR